MTIRKKTGVIFGLTIVVLIVVLYGISQCVLNRGLHKIELRFLDSFRHLEAEDALKNVTRVLDALELQRENLQTKAADWAQWDDTYRFVIDGNSAYRKSNLSVSTLVSLRINVMAIINDGGECVYSLLVDGDSSSAPDVSGLIKNNELVEKVVRGGGR